MKLKLIAAFCVTGCALLGASSPKVPLWPEGKMPSAQANQPEKPYLIWHEPAKRTSTAVLISVSGGSYMGCGVEGFEVAPIRDYFLARGVTVVTMKYRVPRPNGLPKHVTAWQDAQRTVRLVRAEAAKRGLDPENIGFTGCSAGGHLTLMVATSSLTPAYEPIDDVDKLPCHVNWAVPVYPAYALADGLDQNNVKKGNDLSDALAPEFKFDAKTPPMCLMHGDADGWSPMNSVRVYHKLRTMGIPAELHVMALEPHCFMNEPTPGTPADTWKGRVWEWAVKMDIVSGHPNTRVAPWTSLYNRGQKIEDQFDVEPGVWQQKGRRGEITANKDSALWTKAEYENFALDFEYKLEPGANSGVLIYGSDTKNWIPNTVEVQLLDDYAEKWSKDPAYMLNASLYGHCAPTKQTVRRAGEWNRMTVFARGKNIQIICNGEKVLDADLSRWTDAKKNPDGTKIPPWLSRPWADLPTKGKIGFQGMHGKSRPYFRNIRIRPL
jgi:acetyl esterase/lipase